MRFANHQELFVTMRLDCFLTMRSDKVRASSNFTIRAFIPAPFKPLPSFSAKLHSAKGCAMLIVNINDRNPVMPKVPTEPIAIVAAMCGSALTCMALAGWTNFAPSASSGWVITAFLGLVGPLFATRVRAEIPLLMSMMGSFFVVIVTAVCAFVCMTLHKDDFEWLALIYVIACAVAILACIRMGPTFRQR